MENQKKKKMFKDSVDVDGTAMQWEIDGRGYWNQKKEAAHPENQRPVGNASNMNIGSTKITKIKLFQIPHYETWYD